MTSPGPDAGAGAAPRFSIVSAVYNVGRYLDEFIESVEKQTFDVSRIQVVMVNDGSTDDSLERLEAWRKRRPELVTVVSKENGGLPSARNAGLPSVRGEWVTFTDPDDILDRNYFTNVEKYLQRRPESQMVATRRMVFEDRTGEQIEHPLDWHFLENSDRMRDLDNDSGHFHGHAASTFFRTELIQREDLTFDERLRATFEDGHFCNIYLLRAPAPLVGFVTSAEYRYRRRGDGTSQLDRSWANPGRFINVLDHGYLDLLRDGAARRGRAPSWVQGMVLYELFWYFRVNERHAAATAAEGETRERFHELMAQICDLLDETGVETYRGTTYRKSWREMLLHGYRDEPWHTDYGIIDKIDTRQDLMRFTYRFVGEVPDEEFFIRGNSREPVFQKVRDMDFYGRALMQERIVWLPFGTVRVIVGGRDLDLRMNEPPSVTHRLPAASLTKWLDPEVRNAPQPKPESELSSAERAVQRLARTAPVRAYFRKSWVMVDRIFNADDSAEHLFHFLREKRPGVNAWFAIEKGTPDYERLRRSAGDRVLAYGSLRWKLAMLNCEHLVSSHIDQVIVGPDSVRRLCVRPPWRVTFLQHGVMKDDLSNWLNPKDMDIFVTSTQAEYDSVVADHTAYRYTEREVQLTGLPRFDRVLAEGKKVPPDQRDLILVAPTWRNWLTSSEADPTHTGRHIASSDEFRQTEYAKEWTAVLASPELRDLAEKTGLKVALLLHPNLQGMTTFDLPPHVEMLGFDGQNIQRHFARARVLVTDYSSMFFNAAYIDRPIVYFQFDRDRVLAGGHLGRRGYFDYERDGFGPVTTTASEAISAVTKAVDNGPEPDSLYLERVRAAFPVRDGRCCERVADAILDSTREKTPPPPRPLARRIAGRGRRELRNLVGRVQKLR